MVVRDPIYGMITIPAGIRSLLDTPEVRRLSYVRLLNTVSPTLAVLGELRRYSHTLGVLHLCSKVQLPGFSMVEREALAASVLLHDIGTPPFGHLFEYHLREKFSWDHEKVIKAVLRGTHVPENTAHQIFAGRTIEFAKALERTRVPLELVEQIVTGGHPLSQLLFGSLDLDNLDNVSRMAWALGVQGGQPEVATALAEHLSVDRECRVCLAESRGAELVARWLLLRRSVYEIIVFDGPTVAAQAVLSAAIQRAIELGELTVDDSYLSDEELLFRLRSLNETKDSISREYFGRLPEPVFVIQVAGTLQSLGLPSRDAGVQLAEDAVRHALPRHKALGYVFVDKGTFEKHVRFHDRDGARAWCAGSQSASVVFYGFSRTRGRPGMARSARASEYILEHLGVPQEGVLRTLAWDSTRNRDQLSLTDQT